MSRWSGAPVREASVTTVRDVGSCGDLVFEARRRVLSPPGVAGIEAAAA